MAVCVPAEQLTSIRQVEHDYHDLIRLFNSTFFANHNTRLVRGGDEPVYLPAGDKCSYHQIIFARGYYTSALHEIAHWCIAGPERQLKEDWGYWYIPDGRTARQQQKFELVEVRPQAIEWALSVAAGLKFNVSADNLNGVAGDRQAFKAKIYSELVHYLKHGFPQRAQQFINVLQKFYGTGEQLTLDRFVLD
jgi:elongation factor P hydroxylase